MTVDDLIKDLDECLLRMVDLDDATDEEVKSHPIQIAINTLAKFNSDLGNINQELVANLRDYNDLAKKHLALQGQYEAALNAVNQLRQQQAAQRQRPNPSPSISISPENPLGKDEGESSNDS